MSMTDPIADLLTRIRNAQGAGHKTVVVPSSKLKLAILDVLRKEGYIVGYELGEDVVKPEVTVELKYYENKPVIEELRRVSTPGLRQYVGKAKLPEVRAGMGVAIVSTSRGVMTDKAARQAGLGGEVLCTVF